MAREQFRVATYEYYDWSSRTRGKTNLNLRGASGQTCFVWFIEDDGADLPPARKLATDKYAFYYHHRQLPHLVDRLRNEKPIWVFFNDDGGFNNSRISTTEEPVGEGEES